MNSNRRSDDFELPPDPPIQRLPPGPEGETLDEKVSRILGHLLDTATTDEDRLKVIDRVLKKKVIDAKIKDAGFGSAFGNEGD